MSLFPTLSTRRLPKPLLLHPSSCCPTMDVSLLSNPTNSTSDASIHLYRFSGGSSEGEESATALAPASNLGKVWETNVEGDTVVVVAIDPKGKGKGRTSKLPAAETFIQPRLPETLAWSPDGQLFAFGASASSFKLYSVNDGKPILPSIPFTGASTNVSLYLLNWEECLPLERRTKREQCTAEELELSLPRLPELTKPTGKPATPANIFANPFIPGGGKPYSPAVQFVLPSFPSLTGMPSASTVATDSFQGEDEFESTLVDDIEEQRSLWNPTMLMAGDEKGNLHLLFGGAISLGTISLGKQTDIISAFIANTATKSATPLSRTSHCLTLSLLISVPTNSTSQIPGLPAPILNVMPPRKAFSQQTQIVMRCLMKIPNCPSEEITLLARAATGIRASLSHAFEALDDARKAWEEAKEMGQKWLHRLKEDSHAASIVPSYQLLTLLLTGRPANTNLHDYFASKNTEKSFEKWEIAVNAAVIKLRNAAYQSIMPCCERIVIWLDQIRGWSKWKRRFKHLNIQVHQLEECFPLVQLLMLSSARLESLALEEELGFRDFASWIKFELERISAIEAHSDNRPLPKHDVLAVMTYIKCKLQSNPLDLLVLVEKEKDMARYVPALDAWLAAQLHALDHDNLKKEGEEKLKDVLERLRRQENDNDASTVGREEDMQVEGAEVNLGPLEIRGVHGGFHLDFERLYTVPLLLMPQSADSTTTMQAPRRKSVTAATADISQHLHIVPVDLPVPFYLSELANRLASLLDHSFTSISQQAEITDVVPVIAWQPQERQEDDSMTALGLARDPTKITSRVVKYRDKAGEDVFQHWIACETPSDVLQEGSPSAFWLVKLDSDQTIHTMAFSLTLQNQTSFEILDIEFFDEVEVALLLKLPIEGSRHPRHALATVRFREIELKLQEGRNLEFNAFPYLLPVPFHRFHEFYSQFEPLQFALNGRKGRRIGCVLGNLGMVMEVLDMDDEDVDDELDHQENDEQNKSQDTTDHEESEMHQVQANVMHDTFGNGAQEYEDDGVNF